MHLLHQLSKWSTWCPEMLQHKLRYINRLLNSHFKDCTIGALLIDFIICKKIYIYLNIYLDWRRQTFSCTCTPATWYAGRRAETCPHRRWATSPSGSLSPHLFGPFELSRLLWWTDTLWLATMKTVSELRWKCCKLIKVWGSFPKEFRRVHRCVISAHVQSTTAFLHLPASPRFSPSVPPQRLAQVAGTGGWMALSSRSGIESVSSCWSRLSPRYRESVNLVE